MTSISAGSMIGALLGPILGRFKIGITTIICFTLGGFCWMVAGWSSSPILTSILFELAWVPICAVNILFAGLIQSIVPNEILGKTTCITYNISVSAMPIGSLLGGYLAHHLGNSTIFSLSGFGILFIALIWFLHPGLRAMATQDTIDARS